MHRWDFLRANFRFRGDYTLVDVPSYLEFFATDWCDYSDCNGYPVGGMSAFTRALVSRAEAAGARLHAAEPVLSQLVESGA